jgi:hypothetical protein
MMWIVDMGAKALGGGPPLSPESARPKFGLGGCLAPLIWLGVVCVALGLPGSADADWTAFNDQGQTGNADDTSFTIPALGRSSGALKAIATGKALGASLTITVGGGGKAPAGASTMSAPSAGTPAYAMFSPFIDWTAGSDPGIYLYPSNVIDYAFSGLDPAQRYRFTGTAVRGGTASTPGNEASNRWTQAELIGVLDYAAAHSANTVTSNDFPAALSGSQAAWNAGVNFMGDVVEWDNIVPASNGTFTVRCAKYEGPTPGGNAGNSQLSYAFQAIRLDEFDTRSLVQISLSSPVDGTLAPLLAPLAVSAATNGAADVAKVDFYVNGTKIGQAANAPYNFAWAGSTSGTYEFWAVATDTLGLIATSGVAHVTLTNARSGPGTVYLVVGSDTAIWNAGTTVDVYSRYPYYPQGFYTDPSSPSYQVMDPGWRSQFTDSFGQPVKFTWWLMGGNIYRDATNQNVPVPNTMLPYLMMKYHGAALRQFGDELSLHYHTFIWSDYNGDGKYYWNQSRTFDECREDFEYTLAQYLLEEGIFPVSFRSGWHYMDNGWQQELDQLLPYSLHDNWGAYQAWSGSEPTGNVEDWSRAPSVFVPFHPATNDYQVPGTGPGWNLRSIKMQGMAQSDMNTIFDQAANGADQVVCIWDHLPEAFVANFSRVASYVQLSASNYPNVAFRYCTAVEGMQRWRGVFGQDPPEINVTEVTQGQTVLLSINANEPLFQPLPFVALRDVFGHYTNITSSCMPAGSNSWTIMLPVPRNQLAKVGVAATDPAGNLTTRILRYLPDDLYLDNLDPQYAELQGRWNSIANAAWGTDARVAQLGSNETAQVRWSLPISRPGFYRLSVQVPAVTDAARNASFHVYSGGSNIYSVVLAQPLPGNQWVQLGSVPLDPILTNSLEMIVRGADQPGTWAVADVVQIAPLPDPNAPPANHLAISPTARGFLLLFTGEPGQACEILRSTDLLAGWTTIATLTVPPDGLLLYEDKTSSPLGAFYRIAHGLGN